MITLRNDINIWSYTGYKYEQLKNIDYLYKFLLTTGIDVLIDGMFIKELKPEQLEHCSNCSLICI